MQQCGVAVGQFSPILLKMFAVHQGFLLDHRKSQQAHAVLGRQGNVCPQNRSHWQRDTSSTGGAAVVEVLPGSPPSGSPSVLWPQKLSAHPKFWCCLLPALSSNEGTKKNRKGLNRGSRVGELKVECAEKKPGWCRRCVRRHCHGESQIVSVVCRWSLGLSSKGEASFSGWLLWVLWVLPRNDRNQPLPRVAKSQSKLVQVRPRTQSTSVSSQHVASELWQDAIRDCLWVSTPGSFASFPPPSH